MKHLKRMLRDYAPDAEIAPAPHFETIVKAALDADYAELSPIIRGVPVGSVANVAAEMDRVADVLRRAAVNLRNAAASELRHADER